MEKNYLQLRLKLPSLLKTQYLFLIILIMSSISNPANAQVSITKPNLSIVACSGFPSAYNPLGDIMITEVGKGDFAAGTNATVIFTVPTNFEFQAGIGTVAFSVGQNITSASIIVTSSTITITYSVSGTNRTDVITISGLQLRATAASSGNITRTGGTGIISNLVNGTTLTNTLSSTILNISSQPAATTICTNGTTTLNVATTGASTYQWRKNGVNLSNLAPYSGVNASTLTITNPNISENNASFDVVVSSPTPCSLTSSQALLTVNPIIPASVTIAASVNPVCIGDTVIFMANPSNGGANPSYQWKLNGVNVGTNSATFTSSTLANGNTISCVLTSNASPCLSGSPATSNTITMTVNPILTTSVTIASSVNPVCTGSPVTFTASPTNGGINPSYQWKLNGSNVGTNSVTYTSATLVNGDIVTCVLTSNAAPCLTGNPATSNTITMTVNPILLASLTIAASANPVCTGNAVTFTATPTNGGINPSYQWKLNGVNVGTNSAIYSSSTLANGNTISCVLTSNASPCLSGSPTTSNSITMMMIPILPASVTITASANPICEGDDVTFTATPVNAGTTPFYQWKLNGSNVGTNSASFTSSTLANGNTISCVLTSNASPCLSGSPATSNTISMTVNKVPIITIQPEASTVCTNGNTTFNVTATGTTTFQWRQNGVNLSNSAPFSGVNTATLSITNPTISLDGKIFDVLLNSATCPVVSNSATLTIFEKVLITSQPIPSQIFCEGATTTISITATGDGLSYQWYKGATALVDGGAISGAITPILTFDSLILSDGATYHCLVSGTSPCSPVISNNSILNVNKGPIIISDPAISQTICEGSTVSFSVGATTTGSISYQWYKGATALVNGGTISGVKSATLTINPVAISDADADYNCIVYNGCSTETRSSMLIVNPKQNAFATNSNQTICSSNSIIPIVLSGNVSGTTFIWTRNNTVSLTGIASSGSGDISGSLTNTTNAAVTVTFIITPIANSCNGNPITASVLVNPTPIMAATNSAQTICSTSTIATMVLTGNIPGTTFTWTRDNIVSASGIAANGSENISGSLTNNTNAPVTVTFSIIPKANSCSGNSIFATVLVEATSVGGTLSQPVTTVCANSNNGTLTLSGNIGAIVRWDISTNGGFIWTPIANTTNSQAYLNLSQTTLYRVVIKNGSCPFAYSTNAVVSVIPSYTPTITGLPLTICAGETSTLSAISGLPTIGITDGTFNTANPLGWCVDGQCTGSFMSANGDNQDTGIWRETNSHTFNGVSYSSPDPKFAIANGNYISTLETPLFSLIGQSSANLQFLEAYFLEASASAKIEISTNGGVAGSYIVLAQYNGASSLGITGSTATMQSMSIPLNNYLGLSNLKIKFTYTGTANSGWVLDGIRIPNTPPAITYTWTSNATLSNSGIGQIVTASPNMTTTYTLTTTVGGCVGGIQNITIIVNQKPIVTATPSTATICSGDTSNILLTSSETGTTFAWTVVQTNVTGASAGTGTTIAHVLTATGIASGTVIYTITSTSKGCIGIPKLISVTVNPRPTAAIQTSQIICSGATTTFKVLLSGTAPWNITYSDGITPTTATTSANPFYFSIPNITTNKSYTITALSDANCAAKPTDLSGTSVVTVLNGTPGLWTGMVSTDWFDCLNWAGGLPSSTIDAQIPTFPSGSFGMPVIDRTSPFAISYNYIANARDLIIATGASVTMVATNNSELQISRDWKNIGQFIPGTGTVTFNGYTANQIQTINLGIKTKETFYNLTTNTSAGAKGISVVNGFELTVSNNVSLLSGDIRLTGEAQLIQAGTAANPIGGTGILLRDQQGQKNSYNYNYWSSPVSSSTDYAHYSISGVLNDGTDVTTNPFNPTNINFGDGAYFADGIATNPIRISNRWLFAYNSITPGTNTGLQNYYLWNGIGNTVQIKIGEGFTMKGTDATASISTTQNYVFAGKPNSGTLSFTLAPNQTYLIGNPYPSALDADEFIKDNLKDCNLCRATSNVFNGVLSFWDHFGLTSNHYLAQYTGGYATYTLIGGLRAIANDPLTINNNSQGSKIPVQYIPIAQGFFIAATPLSISSPIISGGTLVFKNSQRAFMTESSGNSLFMKSSAIAKTKPDNRPKIRLGFISSKGAIRQILVGADVNTSNLFDLGYEAPLQDSNPDDMYWEFSNDKFIIQGIPDFNVNQIIPLGLTITNPGLVTIKIDALENVSSTTEIYLYDAATEIYHNIKKNAFTATLTLGNYNNRFSLRFTDKKTHTNESTKNDGIVVLYSYNYKRLIIKNNLVDVTINKVSLFDISGQPISNWEVEDLKQTTIQIPIKNINSGIYVVKIQTSIGIISKKIVVN